VKAPSDRVRALAKRLRRQPVSTERTLWRLLRDRRLGDLKFRRQVPIGGFVVDFACMRHRLIVEADGYFHQLKVDRDLARDAWLTAQGFRVLRFDNGLIASKPHLVLAAIMKASRPVAERDVDPSSDLLRRPPSPARGEG
jgi:very-short-patch-repair endonuclease